MDENKEKGIETVESTSKNNVEPSKTEARMDEQKLTPTEEANNPNEAKIDSAKEEPKIEELKDNLAKDQKVEPLKDQKVETVTQKEPVAPVASIDKKQEKPKKEKKAKKKELEEDVVFDESDYEKPKKKKKHYWWRYLLVFLTGIVFTVGSVVGAGAIITAGISAGQVAGVILSGNNQLTVDDILTEDYQKKSILDIILELPSKKFDNLSDIEEITPYIAIVLEQINDATKQYGVTFDKDTLFNTNWNELGEYVKTTALNGITPASLLGDYPDLLSQRAIQYLLYREGTDGNPDLNNPRNVNELLTQGDQLIQNATIGDLIPVGPEGEDLLYGFKDFKIMNLSNDVKAATIGSLLGFDPNDETLNPALRYLSTKKIDQLNDAINTATLGDLLDVGTEGLLFNLKDIKVTELATQVQTMPLKNLIDITPESNPALIYLGDYSASQINEAVNNATLGDLIDVGTEGLLFNLKDVKVNNLANEVQTMKLNQILDIKPTDNKALQYFGQYNINQMNDAINNATVNDLLEVTEADGILYNLRMEKINNLGNAINNKKINEIIDIPADAYPALAYLGNYKANEINDALKLATLGQLIECEPGTILYSLKDCKINEIDAQIQLLTLKEVMTIDSTSSPIMQYLKDTQIKDLPTAVESVPLDKVIDITDPSTPLVLKSLVESGATINNIGDKLNALTLNQIIDTKGNKILTAIGGATLNTIGAKIDSLTLGDAIEIGPDAPIILQNLKATKINELSTVLSTLTLDKMVDVSGNKILTSLGGSTLDSLAADVNNLTLSQMIDITPDSPKILQSLAGSTITQIATKIDTLTLGEMVDTSTSPLLQALAGYKINEIGTAINTLELGQVISIDASSHPILKALEHTRIDQIGTKINTLELGQIVEITTTSPKILVTLQHTTINDLGTAIDGLTLEDVIDIDPSQTILVSLKTTKINEIGTAITKLRLNQIITIDSTSAPILKALANATIDSLGTAVDGLKIGDVFSAEQITSNPILNAIGTETKLNGMAERLGNLTFGEVFKNDIYTNPNDPSTVKSTWKYLLTDASGVLRTDYKISTDMSKLVDNMQRNIQKATLSNLVNDGILTLDDPAILNKNIGGHKIGDLTISGLLAVVGSIPLLP